MSKEEIKNLLIDFICEYDMTSWSNEKVYEKFSDLIYKKFTDLEAKLAESENRVKDLEFRNKNLEHSLNVAPNANAGQRARIVELRGINHKLKQQLAEKDHTINTLIEDHKASQEWYKKQLAEKDDVISFWKKHHRSLKKSSNKIFRQAGIAHIQDKISFAVEQLEKVKEYADNMYGIEHAEEVIEEFIDNQIKQLKEMK